MAEVEVQENISDVVSTEALDHEDQVILSEKIEHFQVYPSESLGAFNWTSGATLTFQLLGSNVYNLEQSYLSMTLSVPAQGATQYIWMLAGCIPMFRSVAWQPQSGNQMLIDQYHHYSKMSLPYLISTSEMQTFDNTNIFYPSRDANTANVFPVGGNSPDSFALDPKWAINLDGGHVNSNVSYLIKIPFKLFAGTILAMNRNLYYGQNVNIQFTFEDPTKVVYSGTKATDPSAGPQILGVTGTGGTYFNIQFSNCYLWLATEQDPDNVARCKAAYAAGYSIYVPYVQKIYQLNLSGSSQAIQSPVISRAMGSRLLRILTAPFNNTETINTSLDNSNNPSNPQTTNTTNRVITFQTMFDSITRQQNYLNASPFVQGAVAAAGSTIPPILGGNDDWNQWKKQLEGSVIQNSAFLGYSWCLYDDWTDRTSRLKKYTREGHYVSGLDLSLGDHTYQVLTTNSNSNYNWYQYIMTQKVLSVGPGYLRLY